MDIQQITFVSTMLRPPLCWSLALAIIVPTSAQTWENLSDEIPGTPWSSGPYPTTDGTWIAGTSGGDYRSTDGGLTWTLSSSGLIDPFDNVVPATFYFKTSTGRILRTGSTSSWNNRIGSPVWYSDNDGQSWSEVPYPFNTPASFGAVGFTAVTEQNGVLFAADQLSHGVWKSTDNGMTWSASRNGLPETGWNVTVHSGIVATETAVFTTAPLGGVYRSLDAGSSWTKVSGSAFPGARDIVALDDGILITIGGDTDLFRSRDGGDSWVKITTSLGQGNIRHLVSDGTRIFAMTNTGVLLESTDGGDSFAVVIGGTPPPWAGSNHRQLSMQGDVLLYTSTSSFYRLDTSSAPRQAIAPVILTHPASKGVTTGKSVTFSVSHSNATLPITYQWKHGDDIIPGATGPELTLTNAAPGDAGAYSVIVTNAGGSAVSNAATLVVGANSPGAIDYEMQPYTIGGDSLRNVYAVVAGLDGSMYAAGEFISSTNGTSGDRVIRFHPDGTLDTAFKPNNTAFGSNILGLGVYPMPDGTVIVGGGSRSGTSQHVFRKLRPDGSVDLTFDWPDEIVGPTDCVVAGPEGTIYVGGAYGIYRVFADTGEIDFSFNPPTLSNSARIRKIAVDESGKLYIVGNFTTVNGRSLGRIARLFPDGSLDTGFSTLTGFNQEVMDIALQDGKPVVVGGFTSYRGTSVSRIARLNTDGTLDADFSPPVFNNTLNAVVVDGEGAVVVGGAFTTVGGTTWNNIARLDPVTDSLDTTFAGNATAMTVNALSALPDGRILVGSAGQFHRVLGVTPTTPRISYLSRDAQTPIGHTARLEVELSGPTSGATFQWFKNGEILSGETYPILNVSSVSAGDSGVYHVEVTIDDVVIVSPPRRIDALGAPVFLRTPQTKTAYLGTRHYISAQAVGVGPLTYQWLKNGVPVSGATSPGYLFNPVAAADAGMWSLRVTNSQGSTESIPFYLAVPPRPGTVDPTFNITGFIAGYSAGPSTLLELANGQYLAAGSFTFMRNGTQVTQGLVRLFADGTFDPSFDISAQMPSGVVRWLFKQADGKILVGNDVKPFRLTSNLEVDPDFTLPHLGYSSRNVQAMHLLSTGKILLQLSGEISGYPRGLIRLHADGELDTTFPAHGATSVGGSPYVTAIAEDADNRILLAGNFTTFSGEPRNRVARLLSTGALDPSFTGPGTFGIQQSGVPTITFIAESPEKSLYIGGDFGDIGAAPARALARLSGTDGSHDPTFYPTQIPGAEYFPFGISFLPDGRLAIAAGRAKATNGGNVGFEVRWPNGALDSRSLPTEISTYRPRSGSLVPSSPGTHFLAIQLNTVEPQRYGAARIFTGDAGLGFASVPVATTVNLGGSTILSVTAGGTSTISYQWKKNGEIIPGATGANLTLNSIQRTHKGSYTVVITNDSGSLESPPAYLDVLAEPEITTQPVSVVVSQGGEVTLSIAAKGQATMTYAWTKDGVPVANVTGKITGATSATLKLLGVSQADAGAYKAVVTNKHGSTSSLIADVEVTYMVGAVDGTWSENQPSVNSSGENFPVRLMRKSDGGFFFGAKFYSISGASPSLRFAAEYSSTGVRNTAFAPPSNTPLESNFVRFATHPSGILYAVAWYSSGGSATLYRFTSNGNWLGAGTLPSFLQDFFFDDSGRLIAASAASTSGKMVRRYTVDTSANTITEDPLFNTSINNYVYGVYPSPATGGYYIAGGFYQVNGQPRAMLARLKADGSLDEDFTVNTSGLQGYTYMQRPFVLESPQGKVHFRNIRLNADGSRDTNWDENVLTIGGSRRGIFAPDGKLLVADSNMVVRFNADGTRDLSFVSPAVNGTIEDLVLTSAGHLYAGGRFTGNVNTQNKSHLIRLLYESPDIGFLSTPQNSAVSPGASVTFTSTTYGDNLSYTWYHKGVPVSNGGRYSGAGTASLTITGILEEDAGSVRLAISNSSGLRSATAYLTVNPPPPEGFAAWDALQNAPADKRGPLDTPDGDGIENLIKYALGLEVGVPAGSATSASMTNIGGVTYPTIVFKRRLNTEGVSIQVIASSTLPLVEDIETEIVSAVNNGDGTETVIVRSMVPVSALPRQFMSVKVSEL